MVDMDLALVLDRTFLGQVLRLHILVDQVVHIRVEAFHSQALDCHSNHMGEEVAYHLAYYSDFHTYQGLGDLPGNSYSMDYFMEGAESEAANCC